MTFHLLKFQTRCWASTFKTVMLVATLQTRDINIRAWAERRSQSDQQSHISVVLPYHISFIIIYLLNYIFRHFLTLEFISALVDATLIHVALNQRSTSINSLGKHSQLFPLFSESDSALLENHWRISTQTHGKKTLNYKTCLHDEFLHQRNILLAFNEHTQPLCQITERLPASSCLQARLAEKVPDSMVTLSKISSLTTDKKLCGRVTPPAPLCPVLIKMLVKRRVAAEWAIYEADGCSETQSFCWKLI